MRYLVKTTILILGYFYPKTWVVWITGKITQKFGLFLRTGFYSSVDVHNKKWSGYARLSKNHLNFWEKQSTSFSCTTYQGKQNGSALLQMNDVWSIWSEHKFFLWQNVQVNCKNRPNFHIKQWRNNSHYLEKNNDSVLLTNEWYTEQLERAKILPIQNVWATQQISH